MQPGQGAIIVNPVWFDTNNNQITSAVCGSIYSMTVPGFEGKTLFAVQTKNGAPQFSGNMQIPMSNYASQCNQDEGSYQLSVYDPTSHSLIGQGSFTVLPAGSVSTVPSSTGTTGATTPVAPITPAPSTPTPSVPAAITTTPAPAPTTSIFSNLTGVDWILIAAVVFAILKQK
jgi:hypothetical protein